MVIYSFNRGLISQISRSSSRNLVHSPYPSQTTYKLTNNPQHSHITPIATQDEKVKSLHNSKPSNPPTKSSPTPTNEPNTTMDAPAALAVSDMHTLALQA